MKGGAQPSPLAALSIWIRIIFPFTAGLTEFSSRELTQAGTRTHDRPHKTALARNNVFVQLVSFNK